MEEINNRFIHQTFSDADLMRKSSVNWSCEKVYKLKHTAFKGENTVIFMPTIQLSYAERSGGVLYDSESPKGTVSAAVITRLDGKMCYGQTKLTQGDVTFFDSKKPYTMVNSDTFFTAIISIPKKGNRKLTQKLAEEAGKVIQDTDGKFAAELLKVRERFMNDPEAQNDIAYLEQTEKALITQLEEMLERQTPYLPKLTKGEKIALQIRDRIHKRVTKKVTISSLAEEFGVSEQTLQNAFKSLFGITPNKFLRNLKLNHVRRMLIEADPESDTIVRIANHWGFTHMGHFSRYYTELFGENPSVTLARTPTAEEHGK